MMNMDDEGIQFRKVGAMRSIRLSGRRTASMPQQNPGSILENVVLNADGTPDFDGSLTNTGFVSN